jgi:hypothetical protein
VKAHARQWRRFGEISKVVQNEDGTLNVYGIASTEERDGDDEVILASAMKEALPDYMKWGAIREMHQPKAAGTALEAEVNEDTKQTWIGVHVVDPVAVKKVRTGTYKGFSVGGSVLERDEDDDRTITKLRWVETSLVDRPSNPGAEILIVKCETAKKGEQLPLSKADDTAKPGEKQYGDVDFADDKNKKYPIDTEAHIRSAWSYINKEKNQKVYSDEEVAAIKKKIVAAWKAKIDKDGPPSAEKLAKGMWDVSALAQMLAQIRDLTSAAEYEAFWENDGSAMPLELRDWLETGAGILKDMADEEIEELIASLQPVAAGTVPLMRIAKMKPGNVSKLMKISEKVHDHADKCMKAAEDGHANADAMDKVLADHNGEDMDEKEKAELATHLKKYAPATRSSGSSGAGDDLAKRLREKDEELAKIAGERDAAIAKAAAAEAKSKELEEGLATVKKEVSGMVEQMQAKGVLRVVTKADDNGKGGAPTPEKIDPTAPDAAHRELVKVYQGGGQPGFGDSLRAEKQA